jgi:hypothetical protein
LPISNTSIYKLKSWSPESADYLIALIEDYPNTLVRQERGENDANYYAAFYYATIAQSEALLRFPDAPQANKWRWGLAYDLARIGDPRAGEHYAELIAAGLNRGETTLPDLEEWFTNRNYAYLCYPAPAPSTLPCGVSCSSKAGQCLSCFLRSAYQTVSLATSTLLILPDTRHLQLI